MLEIINSAVPFAAYLGVVISRMDVHGAVATLPDAPNLKNHIGTQHAGALFSLAESASGAALMAACSEMIAIAPPVVRDANIQYRRPAVGRISATAHLEDGELNRLEIFKRDGRVDVRINVDLIDSGGTEVAVATFEWSFRTPKPTRVADPV